ncbi:MAG: Gingipain precursor, partial [Bacteroidota bacterium]
MRRIFTLVTALIPFLSHSQFEIISESGGNILISCGSGELTFQSAGNDQVIPVIPEGTSLLKEGLPDVPKLTAALIVDDQAEMVIHVQSSSYIEFPDIEIAPSKGNLLRTTDPSTVPFVYAEVYDSNAFFPGQLVSTGRPFVQGQYRGQSFYFHPVQYNPVTKVLRYYTEIIAEILPTDQPGENPLPSITPQRTNLLMNEVYGGHFLNYNFHQNRYDVIGEIGNLLVITDAIYVEELEPWIQWKKEKGIQTEVVDVDDIGGIAEIEDFVADYYANNGLTYLLLVGDEDQVPTQLVNNSGGQGYCDACYGYINGTDSYAEVFVGRFLVHNDSELPVLIDKILEYEKDPYIAMDWFSIGVGIGSNEGQGIGDDGETDWEHANENKTDLLDFTYTEVWELYDSSHGGSSPTGGETADAAGNPTASNLSNIINDGCSLINYTGHGNHSIISTTGFTNNNINSLTNYHKYPYFIIVGCCTGDFDDDSGSGDTFGEAWIKADDTNGPTGGIGGAFSSVFQSWAPPMEGQDEMNHIIADMAGYETRHTLGSIHVHGCASMNDAYGQGGDDMTDTWHLFGDPTVQLRTAFPDPLTAEHPLAVFLGTSEIDVICDTEDAMVCLTIDGEIIGTGIVQGGLATISFEPIVNPGQILVTVTSFNTIPYQATIELLVAEGPYVVDESVQIDDNQGNTNGLADHGEAVLLDVTLENIGIDLATDVEATLSTSDTQVAITDNYHFFGNIDASTNLMAEGAYSFDVAEGVEDQHTVLFDLLITDSEGNTWEMSFPVVLNAPVLECGSITIDDEGGNGRLDEGETATIIVSLANTGQASTTESLIASLIEDSPYIQVVSAPVDLGDFAADSESQVEFQVEVVTDVPDGQEVSFQFDAGTSQYFTTCEYEEVLDIIMEDWEDGELNT